METSRKVKNNNREQVIKFQRNLFNTIRALLVEAETEEATDSNNFKIVVRGTKGGCRVKVMFNLNEDE